MKTKITGVVALLLIVLTLAACSGGSKLNGTYKSQGLIAQTFTFRNDGSVTMSAFGINASGTYEIQGSSIIISYSLFGTTHDWKQPFEKKGSSIYISGTEFVKD